jgi:hypothetical protein
MEFFPRFYFTTFRNSFFEFSAFLALWIISIHRVEICLVDKAYNNDIFFSAYQPPALVARNYHPLF